MRYVYCPLCGSKLSLKPAGDNGDVPYCDSCQQFWFDVFADCVIILVANEHHEIAMLKQNHLSSQYMTFVSGYIEPGESAEESAIREVKEEIGIDIDELIYDGTQWFGKREQLMHRFIAIVKKKDLVLSEEIASAAWYDYTEVKDKLFPNTKGNCTHGMLEHYEKMIAGK